MSEARGPATAGLSRELGLFDATTLVAGSMIGSGIFIVSADIARHVGSAGWVIGTWVITGLITIAGALAYGGLAMRIPKTGGQYAYLRELYSPLVGFLFGWTFFLVIQTGTIAAVAVGFARFLGVLVPWVSPDNYVVAPLALTEGYGLSLSTQQLVAILMLVLLTQINSTGLRLGRWIQNVFTSAKTLALAALILVGIFVGWNAEAVSRNFSDPWTPTNVITMKGGLGFPDLTATAGFVGLMVALALAQVGSLFSSDAWNNLTFASGEVKDPRKTVPRALALGTGIVIALYVLANVAYLVTLPLEGIQAAPDNRVATAVLSHIWGPIGASIMAVAIVVSTFGCNNGLVLAGARVYYAMARDGLFFRAVGRLNPARVPGAALWLQCVWACLLVLPRTIKVDAAGVVTPTGNVYGNLLDYVVFAVLIFYALTVWGAFRLKKLGGGEPVPGHPWLPALGVLLALAITAMLVVYKTDTAGPGLLILLTGVPVYFIWRGGGAAAPESVPD